MAAYVTAAETSHTADQYYTKLVSGITADDLAKWQEQIEKAERDRMHDRSVMDILGAARPAAESIAANMVSRPLDDPVMEWINLAIEVQEKQYVLSSSSPLPLAHSIRIEIQDCVRRLAKHPREEDKNQIESLRQLLIQRLTVLGGVQHQAVQQGFDPDCTDIVDDPEIFDDIDEEDIVDMAVPSSLTPVERADSLAAPASPSSVPPPERSTISIPSTWSSQDNQYRQVELAMRIEQAARTLQSLRDVIAEKSFQYSHVIRVAPKKGVRTRARATIATLNHRISYLGRVYGSSRAAMVKLAASPATLREYQTLLPEHMKSSTAILSPNEPGSTRVQLSWIWQTGAALDSNSPAALQECKSDYGKIFKYLMSTK